MLPWRERWRAFGSIVVDPWTIGLLILGYLLYRFQTTQKDPSIIAALTILISVVTGVLGGLLTNWWSEISGQRILTARGKAAVRSLKLLLGSVHALDRRVREYLGRVLTTKGTDPINPELVKTYLEEVISRCGIVEEEALSSIDNWTDIVPEAEGIRSQIGLITELREDLAQRAEELEQLRVTLAEAKEKSDVEKEDLRKEIDRREEEVTKLRKELQEKRTALRSSTLATGTSSMSVLPDAPTYTFYPPETGFRKLRSAILCSKCGTAFSPDMNKACPKCGEIIGGAGGRSA